MYRKVWLDKAKVFGLDGEQQLVAQHGAAAVQWDVESRDARVGRGQVSVVCWPDGHARHRLETFFRGGQRRRTRPEVNLGQRK